VPAHAVGHDAQIEVRHHEDVILVVLTLPADIGHAVHGELDTPAAGRGLGHWPRIIATEVGTTATSFDELRSDRGVLSGLGGSAPLTSERKTAAFRVRRSPATCRPGR